MWTTIAMWGGVAGLFVSIFAVIILYLTRKNILDILDKDVILFGRNFELKKSAIESAFKLVDEIQEKGEQITLSNDFIERAKKCYNELLCVLSDVRVADEFYNITIDNNEPISETRIANFKIQCRKDIGLSIKKANAVKRITKQKENGTGANETLLRANSISGNNNRPVSTNPIHPTMNTTTPIQQAAPTPRPVNQPTNPMTNPNTQNVTYQNLQSQTNRNPARPTNPTVPPTQNNGQK